MNRPCSPLLSAQQDLQKKIRYLATIRNKLVHERGFNHIPVSRNAVQLWAPHRRSD